LAADRQRIDKWLFFARVTKSRSLAAKLVQTGRVRVNGNKVDQASHGLSPGDTLTITLDRQIRVLQVLLPGERRGPFEEAKTLYEDLSPEPVAKGESLPSQLPGLREKGAGRPTKRDRRSIEKWNSAGED
jgi:ribosome-associated heat shock protein Hsp15